jgi:hypothetical protein
LAWPIATAHPGGTAKQHPTAQSLTRSIGTSEPLSLDILEFDVFRGAFLLCNEDLYRGRE